MFLLQRSGCLLGNLEEGIPEHTSLGSSARPQVGGTPLSLERGEFFLKVPDEVPGMSRPFHPSGEFVEVKKGRYSGLIN